MSELKFEEVDLECQQILLDLGILKTTDNITYETYVPKVHIHNLVRAMKQYAAQFKPASTVANAGVWVKVYHMIAKLPDNADINCFEIDMNGDFLLSVENGKIINAINGWGNNCADTFKDAEVAFLYESQPALGYVGYSDVKELPEVVQLDQIINTYVHGHGSETYKHIQERFWQAVEAINKSIHLKPLGYVGEDEIEKLAEEEYPIPKRDMSPELLAARKLNIFVSRQDFIKGFKAALQSKPQVTDADKSKL